MIKADWFVGSVAARPEHNYVRLLVTIATPFDGHEAAKAGVELSPVVLPSWRDMAAGSPFLLSLRQALPPNTPHHLFFSFVGGSIDWAVRTDSISIRVRLGPNPNEAKKDDFLLDPKPPHLLREWKKSDGGSLKLRRSLKLDYWNYNKPGDLERALNEAAK